MFPGKTHGGLPHKYFFFVLQAARCLHQSRCTNRGRHFRLKSTQVFCRHFVLLLFRKDFFWQYWILFENISTILYHKPWFLSLQGIETCSHNSFLSNLKLWQESSPGHWSRCFDISGVKTINLLNVEWGQIFLRPNDYVDLFRDFLAVAKLCFKAAFHRCWPLVEDQRAPSCVTMWNIRIGEKAFKLERKKSSDLVTDL